MVARDASACLAFKEAKDALELVLGRTFDAPLQTRDDFCVAALKVVVLPLLIDILLTLAVRDITSACTLFPMVQQAQLWIDVQGCSLQSVRHLAEVEWYVGLCQRHAAWVEARRALRKLREVVAVPPRLVGGCGPAANVVGMGLLDGSGPEPCDLVKAETRVSLSRDAILDAARPILARDVALLYHLPGMYTVLPEQQWDALRRAAARRVLFLLLSVFEGGRDFDGAMHDLAVAVAQSPWILTLAGPRHARLFLGRLAAIPEKMDDADPLEIDAHEDDCDEASTCDAQVEP